MSDKPYNIDEERSNVKYEVDGQKVAIIAPASTVNQMSVVDIERHKLWGQPFDGTHDVDGPITIVNGNDRTQSVTLSVDSEGNLKVSGGVWTEKFVSALGKGSSTTGTSGLDEATLWQILMPDGASESYSLSQIGSEHLTDALKDYALQSWVEQQGYAKTNDIIEQLAKKVDTEWFTKLFTVYDTNGLVVPPNDYARTIDSIRSMFGFWTDRYLSALGKTDSVAYHEVYLTDENGNYLTDENGNYITTTRLLAALENGVNEDELWSLLASGGAGDVYENAQIGLEHLTDALKEYVGTLDLSQYASANDVLLLQSYFTNGKANKALRLANTIAIGSATQPVFFTADGVPSVCGDYSSLLTNFSYDNASRLLSLSVGGTDKSLTLPLATTSIAGLIGTGAQTIGGVKTLAAGSLILGSGSQSVTLSVDSEGNLKVSGGVWTEKFVSALGKSDTTTATGLDEATLWALLAADGASEGYSLSQIGSEHLSDALSGYALRSWVEQQGYAKTADLSISNWNSAYSKSHSHDNKTVLDGITSALVGNWNSAYTWVHGVTQSDTDDVINKWSEIIDFLDGIKSSTDLNAIIDGINTTITDHTKRTDNPHSVTKAQVGLGNVENTALSTWSGTSNVTKVGTISSGTWQGTPIANDYLANSSVTIAGLPLSLGGSLTATDLAKKFYWANVPLSATSSTTTSPTFKTIKVGSVTISCDDEGYLHIDNGVYSDGFVSALGKGTTTTTSGMSESDMWEALGTTTETKVIPSEHLDLSGISTDVDLSGYYTSEQTDALLKEKSALGHTHTTSQITDFPTSLKNPTSITVKFNGTEAASYDGSVTKTIDITPSAIGAAEASHTHTKSEITDFPASLKNPTSITWSGYSEGSYDGSETKTIEIPNDTSQLSNGAGYATTTWVEDKDYATNTSLTEGLAKKVDTEWFASLFTVYDSDGLKVEPNDYTKTIDSIRSMFGFWTDRYLAALGKTDSVAYHEVYLTDEAGNYLLDSKGNFITTTRLLAALESGLNEDELWSLLAKDGAGDVYANAQIGLEHLTDALKEYIGTLDLSQYALSTDVTASIADVTKTLGVHTSRTDNPHSVTKAQVGLGNVENTALSTWAGTNKITTLGTITTGTWHGSKIANAYLANSSVSIAGLSVALGGSITAADLAKKFYWANVQLSASSSTTTTPTVKAITIGSVTLSCVDGHLKIDSGVAADGFVSALGTSDTTSTTGMSEADMWEALGTDSTNKVIPAEHLDLSGVSGGSVDLSGYYTSEQTDALLQTKSSLSHTHTKSQITDFPTSLKNPNALTIKLNGTEAASYDGSAAKSVNITPSGIGAAASSHTHTKSQITDFPASLKNPNALSWSGYSSGSYDGSAAKSITIPSNTNQLTNGAGYITSSGSITGNAATATKLATARTLTIGSKGKTFDGSANVSWTLAEIGAAASSHSHPTLEMWPGANAGYGGYIDFHFNSSNVDYTSRIIEDVSGRIRFVVSSGILSDAAITATNFIASSDMRLKDVQRDVEISSEALANAPLFAFRWKDSEDKTEHIGTSAQYWQEECPQLVRDSDGKLGVDYGALGVAAGVSLAREVVELRSEVNELKDRLAKMEAIIAKMGGEL